MVEPAGGAEQTWPIIPEGASYYPLGTKIVVTDYSPPQDKLTPEAIKGYLVTVREEVERGDLTHVNSFYTDLNLSTSNVQSFLAQKDPWIRIEFDKTTEAIVKALVTSGGKGPALIRQVSAKEFLLPQVFATLPNDASHVWGYASRSFSHDTVPEYLPPRCKWEYLERNVSTIRGELTTDLIDSLGKKYYPGDPRYDQGQCRETHHPMQYRVSAVIAGPDKVGEGEQVVFQDDGVSRLEYGKGHAQTETTPAHRTWELSQLSQFTCSTKPELVQIDGVATLVAPKIFQDCQAVVRLIKQGPHGPAVVTTKTIDILGHRETEWVK